MVKKMTKMKLNKTVSAVLVIVLLLSTICIAPMNAEASSSKYTHTKTNKRKSVAIDNKKLPGDFHYQLIKIKGSSSVKKKINNKLNKDYNKFVNENWSTFKSILVEDYNNNRDTSDYICYKDSKVKYQSNKYYSIKFEEKWYVGGIYNSTRSGKVFSKKTGKELKITSFAKGKSSTIKKKLIKAFLNRVNGTESEYPEAVKTIKNTSISSLKFYITKKKIYIFFKCYELEMGQGDYCVSLNR